jgi:hypothetical protein
MERKKPSDALAEERSARRSADASRVREEISLSNLSMEPVGLLLVAAMQA